MNNDRDKLAQAQYHVERCMEELKTRDLTPDEIIELADKLADSMRIVRRLQNE